MNAKELLSALDAFEKEKGIAKEVVIEALKEALEKAYKRNTDIDALCRVEIDPIKGTIEMYSVKNVVDEVEDDVYQIELEEAQKINPTIKVGENLETSVNPDDLNRMAAMQAKQVLTQKIREFEKQSVYDAYIDKKDDIIIGIVDRIEPNFILVNIGKTSAIMKINHIIPGESFKIGQAIRVYVVDVDKSSQGAAVVVSRTEPGFLKRLFENEIHEVYDGTVEIKDIARQAGDRSKVSVFSRNKDVDATGACIGQKGLRIQKISNQILGEKIDIIQYYENKNLYIAEALRPAAIVGVNYEKENNSALVIVKDEDLSLAIGKKGLNARLAVKLTGVKIDIKTLSTALEEGIEFTSIEQAKADYETSRYLSKFKEEEIVEVEEVTINPIKMAEEEVKEVVVEVSPVEVKPTEYKPYVKPTDSKPYVKPTEYKPYVKTTTTPYTSPAYQGTKPVSKPAYVSRKPKDLVIPKAPGKTGDYPAKKPFVKKEEDRVEVKRNVISSKELEDIKKMREEARNYMPVYTENELQELEEQTVADTTVDEFYENVDYDEYDEYYDEE